MLSILSCNTVLYSIIPTTRQLMVFLECGDNENIYATLRQNAKDGDRPIGIGAIANMCLVAFYQEAGPLLVSNAVLDNIMGHKALFDEFASKPSDKPENAFIHELYQKFHKYKRFDSLELIRSSYKQCSYMNTLYDQLQLYINAVSDYKVLRLALRSDKLFNKDQAPEGLRDFEDDITNYLEMWTYLMCSKLPLTKSMLLQYRLL
jgi:hypothetical protein